MYYPYFIVAALTCLLFVQPLFARTGVGASATASPGTAVADVVVPNANATTAATASGAPVHRIGEDTPRNNIPEEDKIRIARIKYRGGGDWYNDPSSLTNLIDFAAKHIPLSIQRSYDDVAIGSRDLHQYPFVFMTGHGNIDVNATEAANMREYLDNGGFLYIDDDYGFDPYVRPVIEKIFPDEQLIELPASHPLYSMVFDFPDGLPKIHEHDGKPPQGFGIFRNGRLVLYYTYESNLADGWAFDVHDNPEHLTEKSLHMGVNLLVYALTSPD